MQLIVNLSAIHTKPNINAVIDAFAQLHYRYATPVCCWPSMYLSKLWVNYLYARHSGLINDYIRGRVTTESFLERVLPLFNFLGNDQTAKKTFITAWNAIVHFEPHDFLKFKELVDDAKINTVYFISNTNQLNVKKILHELKKNGFDILPSSQIDLSSTHNDIPVKIADNMYLYLSYKVGTYKIQETGQSGTPGLLNLLIAKLHREGHKDIQVISQYEGDLEESKKLAIAYSSKDENLVIRYKNSEQYFQTNPNDSPTLNKKTN